MRAPAEILYDAVTMMIMMIMMIYEFFSEQNTSTGSKQAEPPPHCSTIDLFLRHSQIRVLIFDVLREMSSLLWARTCSHLIWFVRLWLRLI
jgi:hypothetical protein